MRILAIDTTATIAAGAICDGDKLITEFTVRTTLTHSETMLPMIKSMLETAKMDVSDIDIFACSAGPGSFTGVRIGVSTIKGLAFASNKPCIGVSTLEALSHNLDFVAPDAIVCPVMDARRGQLYNALFKNGQRLSEDRCIMADELEKELSALDAPVYFVGDGYDVARKLIKLDCIKDTPERLRYQSGYGVALSAKSMHESNIGADFSDEKLSPIYLRPVNAQSLEERNANQNN